jgi:DNA-binding transcriptional MerR regulator
MTNTDLFTAAAPSLAKDVPSGVALAAPGEEEGSMKPAVSPEEIPDKLYFRIGEVARLAGIKPYVLRFWETEFPSLGPKKSGTGHRLYRRKDVQLVLDIKTLLYEKRFTIEGARKHLEIKAKTDPAPTPAPKRGKAAAAASAKKAPKGQAGLFDVSTPSLDVVRKELADILAMLK